MPKSKFQGKVQARPKLNSYTLVVFDEDQKFVTYQYVKALDVEGAKSLVENDAVILDVLKGHPEVVG